MNSSRRFRFEQLQVQLQSGVDSAAGYSDSDGIEMLELLEYDTGGNTELTSHIQHLHGKTKF
jgi:hypothetical protein